MTACAHKLVYYTKSQAYKAVRDQHRLYQHKLYFYLCETCGFWHLSKSSHKKKRYVIRTEGIEFYV